MMLKIFSLKSQMKKLIFRYAPPEIIPLMRHLRSKSRYLSKNITVVSTLPVESILIIAPHPDDEAIGMGGTLGIHLDGQSQVTVLYMTDGRHGGSQHGLSTIDMIDVRRKEAESIGKKYHINQIFWNAEDTCLTNDDDTISEMIKVLKNIRPKIIYLPSFFDYHYDHFAANRILAEALKRTSASPITIIGYEVWDNIPYPNYVVDISAHFEKKKEILSHYTTQLEGADYIKLCKYRNMLHYALYINSKTEGYAEAFCCLDSETYQDFYNDYLYALRKSGSNLPVHIMA